MSGQEKQLEISQFGLETTHGTAVAATRKGYTLWSPFDYTKDLVFAEAQTGTLEPDIDATYRRPNPSSHPGVEALTFEDFAWWCQCWLKGGVSGSGDGGSPQAYTYTFDPSNTAEALKSFTLERGTTGLPYKFNQAMVNSATVRINPDTDAYWMLDIEAMSRKPTQTAMTGSISDRTREYIKAPGTVLYIDDAGGTIGTTQVTGKFIGGSVTVLNNLDFKAFAEDEDDQAANKVGIGKRQVTAQLTFEHDSDTEFANYRANVPVERLVRIQREGTQIHGGTVTNKRARIDLYGFWSAMAMDYRNNNKIITLTLTGRRNVSASKTINVAVVNALSTLP